MTKSIILLKLATNLGTITPFLQATFTLARKKASLHDLLIIFILGSHLHVSLEKRLFCQQKKSSSLNWLPFLRKLVAVVTGAKLLPILRQQSHSVLRNLREVSSSRWSFSKSSCVFLKCALKCVLKCVLLKCLLLTLILVTGSPSLFHALHSNKLN